MHTQRAILLMEQGRHELAEQELRRQLALTPDDALAHTCLALCLLEREQYEEATAEARAAIALAPDNDYMHYVLGRVHHGRNREGEALESVQAALALNPHQPATWGLLASVRIAQRNWPAALEAAETGLSIDAEHHECANFRAMALTQLGRRQEAGWTLGAALARDPENAVTHANRAWGYLHEGQPRMAQEHFREALRLDPNLEWARSGMVEALKANNLFYRLMLAYFLWMNRLARKAQWAIIIGGYLGYQAMVHLGNTYPALRPLTIPLIVAYALFVWATWLSVPIFNSLLAAHPFGRHVLSREQKHGTTCFLVLVGATVVCLIIALEQSNLDFVFLGIICLVLTVPVMAGWNCEPGWPRWVMFAAAGVLAVAGCLFSFYATRVTANLWIAAALGSMILANTLPGINPRK